MSLIFLSFVGHHQEDEMKHIKEMKAVLQLATEMNKLNNGKC